MDTSLRTLVVALIVVSISGRDGSSHGQLRLCYETRQAQFCADLRPAQNLTAHPPPIGFSPNLAIQVPNTTKLNLSTSAITNLRFQQSTVQLMLNLDALSCRPDEKCEKRAFTHFTFDNPAELSGRKASFDSLEVLILSHNSIRNISEIFAPLANLQILDLSHNLITDLDGAFPKSSRLVTLKLNNNLIESLRKQTFQQLRNLQTLDLSGNRLGRFNLDIFEYLSDLLVLRINENFRSAEESSFMLSAGQRFERLEMAGNGLTRIPMALTRSIRELDLSANELVSIQCGEMDSYPLLQTLSLKNNKLEVLEEDSLGRLEYLIELILHGNGLKQIPLSLPLILRRLDLGSNRIANVRKTDLEGLASLRVLILRDNKIEYLDEAAFSPVTKLDYLDLARNPIRVLTSRHFERLSVVNLQLSGLSQVTCEGIVNCFSTFPFTELDHVEVLNLDSSPILVQELLSDESALHALCRLKHLNMANANLTTLSPGLVTHLPRLEKLELEKNPLNCSGMGWLKDWLISMKPTDIEMRSEDGNSSDQLVTVRIVPSHGSASIMRLAEGQEVRSAAQCFHPHELRGKLLLDLTLETPSNETTKFNLLINQTRQTEPQESNSSSFTEMYVKPSVQTSITEKSVQLKAAIASPTARDGGMGKLVKELVAATGKDNSIKNSSIGGLPLNLPIKPVQARAEKNPVVSDSTAIGEIADSNIKSSTEKMRLFVSEKSLELKASELNLEGADKSNPPTNSISSSEKSDEVYYQSDEPEVNADALRSKETMAVVRNFSLMHAQDLKYVTDETPRQTINYDGPLALSLTSSELEETKTVKLEVKSINKTHIEQSRAGVRKSSNGSKLVQNIEVADALNDTTEQTLRPTTKALPFHPTEKLKDEKGTPTDKAVSSQASDLVVDTSTEKVTPVYTPMYDKKSSGDPGSDGMSNDKTSIKSDKQNKSGESSKDDDKRPRVERQEVTVVTPSPPLKDVPTSGTTTAYTEPDMTTQKPRKNKSIDEKAGPRLGRKKQSKKPKEVTTTAPKATSQVQAAISTEKGGMSVGSAEEKEDTQPSVGGKKDTGESGGRNGVSKPVANGHTKGPDSTKGSLVQEEEGSGQGKTRILEQNDAATVSRKDVPENATDNKGSEKGSAQEDDGAFMNSTKINPAQKRPGQSPRKKSMGDATKQVGGYDGNINSTSVGSAADKKRATAQKRTEDVTSVGTQNPKRDQAPTSAENKQVVSSGSDKKIDTSTAIPDGDRKKMAGRKDDQKIAINGSISANGELNQRRTSGSNYTVKDTKRTEIAHEGHIRINKASTKNETKQEGADSDKAIDNSSNTSIHKVSNQLAHHGAIGAPEINTKEEKVDSNRKWTASRIKKLDDDKNKVTSDELVKGSHYEVPHDSSQSHDLSDPSTEELKRTHDKKSDFANAKLANSEGKEDLEKSGSHPGMLIFLLIVSVLLFTLSLMLISHWTWCKRLNMYELGDQQILEESDYEINSLTNFKEPERW